jgi:hypothetical protein
MKAARCTQSEPLPGRVGDWWMTSNSHNICRMDPKSQAVWWQIILLDICCNSCGSYRKIIDRSSCCAWSVGRPEGSKWSHIQRRTAVESHRVDADVTIIINGLLVLYKAVLFCVWYTPRNSGRHRGLSTIQNSKSVCGIPKYLSARMSITVIGPVLHCISIVV